MKDILSELRKNGIRLNVVNEELEVLFPKGFDDEVLVDKIKKNKTQLMELVLANRRKTAFASIDLAPLSNGYKLSSSQRRLWILDQLDDSVAYNMSTIYEIKGDLNHALLEESFESLIERHEVLRTSFSASEDGEVVQYIKNGNDVRFDLQYENFANTDKAYERARPFLESNVQKKFDLSNGLLLGGTLIKVGNSRYLFALTLHHIISDGWSMKVLIHDLLAIYDSKLNNTDLSLPILRIQYKDYAYWQQQQLADKTSDLNKKYWLTQLSGELPVFDLPGYKARPSIKTYNGGMVKRIIPAECVSSLQKLCKHNGGTLFMGLLASLNALLCRYSGLQDILIGTPIAGRDHIDLASQIGFYVNTIVLRTQFNQEDTFNTLLQKVKHTCLEGYAHQSYPFDELVGELNPTRDFSRDVLFDVMISLTNLDEEKRSIEGVEVSIYQQEHRSSKFDLSFDFVLTRENDVLLYLEYNTDIYQFEFCEQLANHFELLLNKALLTPNAPISLLDYLAVEEYSKLINQFNDTYKYQEHLTFIDIFKLQVLKTPNAIAVRCNDRILTYKELDKISNQLANYLKQEYSIVPDDLIAIKLDRSEWLLIGILAILKSGAAYIPIDPLYPEDRIKFMESNSESKLLISNEELVVFKSKQDQYSEEIVTIQLKPEHLAYVIYTSGSTGKPKGVMIEHAGMLNHLDAMVNLFNLSSESRIVQNASSTFDISVWQFLNALMVGGTTVIYDADIVLDTELFVESLVKDQITILQLVPSYMNAVLDLMESNEAIDLNLDFLLVTGEIVNKQLLERWFICFPNIPVVNAYGPAEAADDISFYIMEQAPQSINVPIGKPIQNTSIYILDANGLLCPIGVEGEICVSGVGVGRGYLNDKEKTAKSFGIDPFQSDKKIRMYKTGDLGRWLMDGNLEFAGRKDDQVKVRGHRIELGEIENAIQLLENIEVVVVAPKSSKNGDKQLVAYVVSKDKQELNIPLIKAHLISVLPAYMVPTFFQMEELPLNPNGKIDKKRLPNPGDLDTNRDAEYVAARNTIEYQLVLIWEELLGKERIGIMDDFFALGGHSISAIRLLGQISKKYGLKIPIRELFANTTIEALGRLISAHEWILNPTLTNKEDRTIIEL